MHSANFIEQVLYKTYICVQTTRKRVFICIFFILCNILIYYNCYSFFKQYYHNSAL